MSAGNGISSPLLPNRIMEIPDTVPRGFPCFLCQRTNRRIDDPSATIEFKNPKKKEEEEEEDFFLLENAWRMDEGGLAEEKFDLVKRSWLGSWGPLKLWLWDGYG